jgi:IrrE N-terminal-like domain
MAPLSLSRCMDRTIKYFNGDDARDPTLVEIEAAFLKYVEDLHSYYDYESDFRILAGYLGIDVFDDQFSLAVEKPGGGQAMFIEASTSTSRQFFSGWHELSHCLFAKADSGNLKAYFREHFWQRPDDYRSAEEHLCNKAAGLFIIPTPVLHTILSCHNYGPLSVHKLAERTNASLSTALRRVIFAHDIDVHAIICDPSGKVSDSIAHGSQRGRYNIGCNYEIEADHPVRAIRYKPLEPSYFCAPVPFRWSRNSWNSEVIAVVDTSSRLVAFFLDRYPDRVRLPDR